jgi:hypothetical protein
MVCSVFLLYPNCPSSLFLGKLAKQTPRNFIKTYLSIKKFFFVLICQAKAYSYGQAGGQVPEEAGPGASQVPAGARGRQ